MSQKRQEPLGKNRQSPRKMPPADRSSADRTPSNGAPLYKSSSNKALINRASSNRAPRKRESFKRDSTNMKSSNMKSSKRAAAPKPPRPSSGTPTAGKTIHRPGNNANSTQYRRSAVPVTSNIQTLAAPNESRRHKVSSLEHAEHIRATQRKRTITSALFLSVVVILIMVVTAAAILYVADYVAAKPNYSFVANGTIEHSIGATALIIRDEQTYISSAEGSLVSLALEGSRVCKEQELAMVIPVGLESNSALLRNTQQQIVSRQRELMDLGKGTGADTICLEADNEILPIINMIRTDSVSGSLSNLISFSSSVQVLMDKRDSDLQSIDFQDEQLTALIAAKTDLENTLSAQAGTLIAEIPGIVSYKLDGFENTLTSAFAAVITPEEYADYVRKSKGVLSSDLQIAKDDPALRICQNAEQYLVTLVSGRSVTDFPVDSTCDIRVSSEGVVIDECKVIRSVQSTGGVFVVFRTTSQVERLLDRRTAEIEIIQSSTMGLRVPASALLDADYTTGYAQILYNSSGYARKLTVTVVDHDREYAVIAPVQGFDSPNLSTIIITNPNTISEGDKVEQ